MAGTLINGRGYFLIFLSFQSALVNKINYHWLKDLITSADSSCLFSHSLLYFSQHLGQYKKQQHGVCIDHHAQCIISSSVLDYHSSLSSPSSISFKLIISNVPRPRVSALRVSSITL